MVIPSTKTGKREKKAWEENGKFITETRYPVHRQLDIPVQSVGNLELQLQTCEE